MKSISVFCGSSFNGDLALLQVIEQLADAFTRRDITLVYGGANVGMMGILADAVLSRGGRVIGVLPQFLMDKEVAHTGLTELHIVDSMHARKQLMSELSDGTITIPGGIGTLDEFFEIYTWLQLGLHNNPIGLLNV
ncbi:MAG: TIGR00730 family Rossman fold protein, partial [Sphingobacteriales bacterium]